MTDPEAVPPAQGGPERSDDVGQVARVPARLSLAAGYAGRMLVVAVAVLAVGYLLWQLRVVALPVLVALVLTTLLGPPAQWLKRRGWRPFWATSAVFAVALVVLGGVVAAIVPAFVGQLDDLVASAEEAIEDVQEWLATGPLGVDEDDLEEWIGSAGAELEERSEQIASGAIAGTLMVGEFVVGLILTVVLTFFFVKDGDRMCAWVLAQVRSDTADDLRASGRAGWKALTGYFRGTTVDGVVEATLIGTGLVLLGVPLALPLAVITFFGGYFPLVGAVLAGALAALVALASEGPLVALAVIALAVVVQNVVSNLVDPLVMGRAVKLHPVVVLLSVTSGAVLGGVIGAFIAVPIVAVTVGVSSYYLHDKPRGPGLDGTGSVERSSPAEAESGTDTA